MFYRLNVFPIELPALRERTQDIPWLVKDLVERMVAAKKDAVQFTDKALALMMQHPWPGNIRELSNFIERLAITNPNIILDATDLPEKFQSYETPDDMFIDNIEQVEFESNTDELEAKLTISTESRLPDQGIDLKEYLSDLEVNLIQQALTESNGVVAHAAKLLNMRRTTLVEKLRKYELTS